MFSKLKVTILYLALVASTPQLGICGVVPSVSRLNDTISGRTNIPANCVDAYYTNRGDDIYTIKIPNSGLEPFNVYCSKKVNEEMPWTVIQRRVDWTQSFDLSWTDYKNGFGDLERNFFIGLDNLHALTSGPEPQDLLIELRNVYELDVYAKYDRFVIGDEYEQYALKELGGYVGNAGDSLRSSEHMKFTTRDADNDLDPSRNLADDYKGAWWWRETLESNLNGIYGSTVAGNGIQWYSFTGPWISAKYAQMSIRPSRKN